jgi:hypothetical protein
MRDKMIAFLNESPIVDAGTRLSRQDVSVNAASLTILIGIAGAKLAEAMDPTHRQVLLEAYADANTALENAVKL